MNKAENSRNRRLRLIAGFSMMEMAVVIGVVGVILGGVLAGTKLVDRAENNSVINQLLHFSEATKAFESKYGTLPGDVTIASGASTKSLFSDTVATVTNGNGNGIIDPADDEDTYFWTHLNASGFLTLRQSVDTATGAITNKNMPITQPGTGTVPAGEKPGSRFRVISLNDGQLAFDYSIYNAAAPNVDYPVMTPKELWQIDNELDDGKPNGGTIRAVENTNVVTAGDCIIKPDTNPLNNVYNIDNANETCILRFIMERGSTRATFSGTLGNCNGAPIGTRRTSANECPEGYRGRILETCIGSGTPPWVETHRQCEVITCDNSFVLGESRVFPCPKDYDPSSPPLKESCGIAGLWERIGGNNCIVPDLPQATPCVADKVLPCPIGDAGYYYYRCMGGVYTVGALGSCTEITCSSDTVGHTQTSATSCPANYIGTVEEVCTMAGQYMDFRNHCVPDYAGSSHACSVGGTKRDIGCPPGETGSHIETCSGSRWYTETNTCEPITCNKHSIGSYRTAEAAVQCESGIGIALEVCSDTGDWIFVDTNCTP